MASAKETNANERITARTRGYDAGARLETPPSIDNDPLVILFGTIGANLFPVVVWSVHSFKHVPAQASGTTSAQDATRA